MLYILSYRWILKLHPIEIWDFQPLCKTLGNTWQFKYFSFNKLVCCVRFSASIWVNEILRRIRMKRKKGAQTIKCRMKALRKIKSTKYINWYTKYARHGIYFPNKISPIAILIRMSKVSFLFFIKRILMFFFFSFHVHPFTSYSIARIQIKLFSRKIFECRCFFSKTFPALKMRINRIGRHH